MCLAATTARADDAAKFELAEGERIVLIGDTLIERDQSQGYLETRITAANPEKSFVFRNLGWSGDTVFGAARAGFGTEADGFHQLKEHVIALKPTLIIVGYGMSDSFQGETGLPRFVAGLNALLDSMAVTKARFVLLSPIMHENLGRPLPDPTPHNRALKLYCDAIEQAALQRGYRYVNLFEKNGPADERLTDNGIHLTRCGYWVIAKLIESNLWPDRQHDQGLVEVSRDGTVLASQHCEVSEVRPTSEGIRFKCSFQTLPPPLLQADSPRTNVPAEKSRELRVIGLAAGRYGLKIDDTAIGTHTAQEWQGGVSWTSGPEFDQVERLRQAIVAKNQLYFYRWRPQNETYLFGFRKHEQGQNAREIPLFDPLVDAQEKVIAHLRVPLPHVYELTRKSEAAQ